MAIAEQTAAANVCPDGRLGEWAAEVAEQLADAVVRQAEPVQQDARLPERDRLAGPINAGRIQSRRLATALADEADHVGAQRQRVLKRLRRPLMEIEALRSAPVSALGPPSVVLDNRRRDPHRDVHADGPFLDGGPSGASRKG